MSAAHNKPGWKTHRCDAEAVAVDRDTAPVRWHERSKPWISLLGTAAMNRTRTTVAALLVAGACLTSEAIAQSSTPQVVVYSTYFEADGMRFESIEELRGYLSNAPNDFYSIYFRDCAAKEREAELRNVVFGVLFERLSARGETKPFHLLVGSIPCP